MKPAIHPMLTALSVPSDVAACHTAFYARACMQAKYASAAPCFKTLPGPAAGEHTKFLAARREWVGQHSSDPIRARLCSRAALREAHAMLDVEKREACVFRERARSCCWKTGMLKRWDRWIQHESLKRLF